MLTNTKLAMLAHPRYKWFTGTEVYFFWLAPRLCILRKWNAYWCQSRPMRERVMIMRRRHVMLTGARHG